MPANRPTTVRAWIATMLALVLISGHVAGLQVLAWTGMLLSRAPERGLAMAVRSTFDGSEPCDLCCAVAQMHQLDAEAAGTPERPSLPNVRDRAPDFAPVPTCSVPALASLPNPEYPLIDCVLPRELMAAPEPPPPRS